MGNTQYGTTIIADAGSQISFTHGAGMVSLIGKEGASLPINDNGDLFFVGETGRAWRLDSSIVTSPAAADDAALQALVDAFLETPTSSVNIVPVTGDLSDAVTRTITDANVSQQVFAANPSRRYLLIQNTSDTVMRVNFGAAATLAGNDSFELLADGTVTFEDLFQSTQQITIICSVAAKEFVAKEG